MGSGSSIFPTLEVGMSSYIAGVWKGYAEALTNRVQPPSNTVNDMGSNWQGKRADLFNQWWTPAMEDLYTLVQVANLMSEAFTTFSRRVTEINSLIDQMTALVTANTEPSAWPNRYTITSQIDQYGSSGGGSGSSSGGGNPMDKDAYYITIYGFDVEGPMGPGMPTRPAWFTKLMGLMRQVEEDYDRAANAAAGTLSAAPGLLKGLSQIKEISRGAASFSPTGPFASLNDPTWNLLTGGGVFRPTLAPGFRGNPFNGAELPSWYHPTWVHQVTSWIGDHIGDIVDVASLVLALTGNPELATALELVYNGAEDAKAVADGKWGDVALDSVGLVVTIASSGAVGSSAEHAAEDFSLGHGFSEAIQESLDKEDGSISSTVSEHVGDYVQGKVEDYIKEQITAAVDRGEPVPAHVTVPPGVLSNIMSQAVANIGTDASLHAAGLPTSG